MEKYTKTEAEAFIDLGRQSHRTFRVEGPNHVVVAPPGFLVQSIPFDPVPALPDHIRQTVNLLDLASFAAYIAAFKKSNTIIFANITKAGACFTAIFDYHHAEGNSDIVTAASQVERAAHRAIYPCPVSPEWETWTGKDRAAMKQTDFAKFIDDNIPDIVKPDSASLLDIVNNFEAHSDAKYNSRIVRNKGSISMSFVEDVEGGAEGVGGKIQFPDSMILHLPVFNGGKVFEVTAKLGFSINGAKLSLWYELVRPHKVMEAAVKTVVADVIEQTGITPIAGTPN